MGKTKKKQTVRVIDLIEKADRTVAIKNIKMERRTFEY